MLKQIQKLLQDFFRAREVPEVIITSGWTSASYKPQNRISQELVTLLLDFFRVMGKAFAIVFGSTSALVPVLILLALAMRPILRSSQAREGSVNAPIKMPPVALEASPAARDCTRWDEKGRCVDFVAAPPGFVPNLLVDNCDKDVCSVYDSLHHLVGFIPRDEIIKAQRIPADQHKK